MFARRSSPHSGLVVKIHWLRQAFLAAWRSVGFFRSPVLSWSNRRRVSFRARDLAQWTRCPVIWVLSLAPHQVPEAPTRSGPWKQSQELSPEYCRLWPKQTKVTPVAGKPGIWWFHKTARSLAYWFKFKWDLSCDFCSSSVSFEGN